MLINLTKFSPFSFLLSPFTFPLCSLLFALCSIDHKPIPLKICKKCCGLRKNCIYLRCEETDLGTRVPNFCTYRKGWSIVLR